MSELSRRMITAGLLLPLAAAWILYVPSPWFDWLLGLLALAMTWELLQLVAMPRRLAFLLTSAPAWWLLVAGSEPLPALLLLALTWFSLVVLLGGTEDIGKIMRSLALGQWTLLWLWFFVWVAMAVHAQQGGAYFLAGACIGVWTADIAAYFAGRRFGKRKLCPAISPGKTRAGLAAAFAFGIPAAATCWYWLVHLDIGRSLLLAFALVAAGVLGDLAESALKRSVGVKDSGHWLPGHGGLLDRLDALMLGLPVGGALWMML